MTSPYDLAEGLVAELRRLGAPMCGSFAWSPDRVVLDFWTDEGNVQHVSILPGLHAEECAPFVAVALRTTGEVAAVEDSA
jgi:hypothetical protein